MTWTTWCPGKCWYRKCRSHKNANTGTKIASIYWKMSIPILRMLVLSNDDAEKFWCCKYRVYKILTDTRKTWHKYWKCKYSVSPLKGGCSLARNDIKKQHLIFWSQSKKNFFWRLSSFWKNQKNPLQLRTSGKELDWLMTYRLVSKKKRESLFTMVNNQDKRGRSSKLRKITSSNSYLAYLDCLPLWTSFRVFFCKPSGTSSTNPIPFQMCGVEVDFFNFFRN